MEQQHEENMEKIKRIGQEAAQAFSDQAVAWLKTQLHNPPTEPSITDKEVTTGRVQASPKQVLMEQLHKQQHDIQRQMEELTAKDSRGLSDPLNTLRGQTIDSAGSRSEQELLLEQIRTTLAPRESGKDYNKALLRALVNSQNKTSGCSRTSTLKPDMLSRLTGKRSSPWLNG